MNTEQKCDKCLAHNITIDHECPPLMRALKENHDSKNPPCDEPGCTVCNSSRHHTEQKGSRNIDFVAMNIVYQIGDALYDALPPNIAREHFVEARQSTNDVAIDFAAKLIERTLQEQREEMVKQWEAKTDNLVKDILSAICHELKYRYIYIHSDDKSGDPVDMLKLTDRLYEEFSNPFNRPHSPIKS